MARPGVTPPLLIDEDFPFPTTLALRALGYPVTATVETSLRGLDDFAQLRRAAEAGAILISANYRQRRQFGRYAEQLRRAGFPEAAAVMVPNEPPGQRLLLRTRLLLAWRATVQPAPALLVWHDVEQRLIHGQRLPGFSDLEIQIVLGRTSS